MLTLVPPTYLSFEDAIDDLAQHSSPGTWDETVLSSHEVDNLAHALNSGVSSSDNPMELCDDAR